jgi:hypothetical protein
MVSNVAQRNLSLVAGNVTGGGGQPPQKTTYWHHLIMASVIVEVRFAETDFVARKGYDIN